VAAVDAGGRIDRTAVPARAIALLFVAGEVALFIFIRDSLVLNFIGLVLGRPFTWRPRRDAPLMSLVPGNQAQLSNVRWARRRVDHCIMS
jgi:hypothetical protein